MITISSKWWDFYQRCMIDSENPRVFFWLQFVFRVLHLEFKECFDNHHEVVFEWLKRKRRTKHQSFILFSFKCMALSVCSGRKRVDRTEYHLKTISGWRQSENIQTILHFVFVENDMKLFVCFNDVIILYQFCKRFAYVCLSLSWFYV